MDERLTWEEAGRARLADLRVWRRAVRPRAIGRVAEAAYTVAISLIILGPIAYGTASSALASVITPVSVPTWGPSVLLVGILVAARWGIYQGPVVFPVPDVAFLLGAPLPRRRLVAPRLARGFAVGIAAGAVLGAVAVIGLAGDGRGIAPGRAAGMIAGIALCAALSVAAALAVEYSPRWERVARRAGAVVFVAAAALVPLARSGPTGRLVASWSGPWGWAIAGGSPARRAVQIGLLAAVALVASVIASRRSGECPTERHMRRAEARAGALASLGAFDARTARLSLRGTPGTGRRRVPALRAMRRPALAILWRDAVGAARTPLRALESGALAAGGALLVLLDSSRVAGPPLGAVAIYVAGALLLEPMRGEIDRPSRSRVLLRRRFGRIMRAHAVLPVLVVACGCGVAAVACGLAGGLPRHGGVIAALSLTAAPIGVLCASMSARRGGRLPPSVLLSAGTDPAGGGVTVAAWLVAWPALAALVGGGPAVLVARKGLVGLALVVALLAIGGLAYALDATDG